MPSLPITVPGVGESITEGILARWLKPDGSLVSAGDPLFELETDKASNVVPAQATGVLRITVVEGETVAIGASVGTIDPETKPAAGATPSTPSDDPAATPPPAASSPARAETLQPPANGGASRPLSPAVRRIVAEHGVDPAGVAPTGPGGRLTKGDVIAHLDSPRGVSNPPAVGRPDSAPPATPAMPGPSPRPSQPAVVKADARESRQRMSGLRQKIAQRLVEAQQTAAILTTFNEVDMSRVMELRGRYKEGFLKKHEVPLGFMSFFVKAAIEALKAFPAVNSRIDGTDIVTPSFYNIGVAVSTERGLIVPVIRDADALSFAGIEKAIVGFADKAKKGTISVDELQGGTFTITNGGVFGSLMSTPILNPPQSGILGMHTIKKRPVVVDDQIVIRPMMYLALSYDHRIIDGREAVSSLVRIKECIEDPERLLLAV